MLSMSVRCALNHSIMSLVASNGLPCRAMRAAAIMPREREILSLCVKMIAMITIIGGNSDSHDKSIDSP